MLTIRCSHGENLFKPEEPHVRVVIGVIPRQERSVLSPFTTESRDSRVYREYIASISRVYREYIASISRGYREDIARISRGYRGYGDVAFVPGARHSR